MPTPSPSQGLRVVWLAGPSGVGKSTLAAALASRHGWPFVEADDYHPDSNRQKMQRGIALDDADRWPWLSCVAEAVASQAMAIEKTKARDDRFLQLEKCSVLVACSALKRRYRAYLQAKLSAYEHRFLLLHATQDKLSQRVGRRCSHFMPASLVGSQLAAFEPASPDEASACNVDAGVERHQLLKEVTRLLNT